MRIAEIFTQGAGHGYEGHDHYDGYDWHHGGAYRPSGYFYRRYGAYYCYNDGCGYKPKGRFLDLGL